MNLLKLFILFIGSSLLITSCGNVEIDKENKENTEIGEEEGEETAVELSIEKFNSIGMKVDTLAQRNMSQYVEVNGTLEVPPQHQASVTAIVGANIVSIEVIEGKEVKKGQVLAYLSHPNLIKIQTDYVDNWSQLQYKKAEDKRQEELYKEKVGSGKEYQKVHADYLVTKAMTQGLEVQLSLMGMNAEKIRGGFIYNNVPLISSIKGYVKLVNVKVGQFVKPETELFQIINIEEVHADFMVFEKDVHRVRLGQQVIFTSEALPGVELSAKIHSVGKYFEQDPKAIHLHAEIDNKSGLLIPGMYVRGRIIVGDDLKYALPIGATVSDGEKAFVFVASKEGEHWLFEPLEVKLGIIDNQWVEIKLLDKLPPKSMVAWNNAYYLMADLKKSETGDDD